MVELDSWDHNIVALLKAQKPASDLEAASSILAVIAFANHFGVPIYYRDEGQPEPEGLYLYPGCNEYSTGATFKRGEKRTGWRWAQSTQLLDCFDE